MKRVLIVDDIKGWRDFNSDVIRVIYGNDCEIITAECAKEAYDILLKNEPLDVIITDLQMEDDFAPKHAGEWLIEQIHTFSMYYKTKIIIVSAASNIRSVAKMYTVDCIPKSSASTGVFVYKEILN